MKKREKLVVLILALLLIVAVAYIVFDKYNEYREQERIDLYRQGFDDGVTTAIGQLVQASLSCQPVPVTFQNITVNMIAVECLQQQATETTETSD